MFYVQAFTILSLLPTLVQAKPSAELHEHEVLDFIKVGGGHPAYEIYTQDNHQIWLHGCHAGASVTYYSDLAPQGVYTILNSEYKIEVNAQGKLSNNLYHIKEINCYLNR